ncbi:MAG TPA: hypothetical protein VGB74_08760 [Actinoplanes sp.]|jgi:hypothetical protein
MRRVVLSLAIGGVLLSAAACGTSRDDDKSATPNVAPASGAAAQPGQVATKSACEALGAVYSKNMAPFAKSLTDVASGKGSPKSAQQSLKAFATAVRGATETSTDAQLRADGKQAADRLQAKAGDATFFSKIKTSKDVDTVLVTNLKEWLSPVSHHCS